MRVDHKKERWGESSPLERTVRWEFTMRKSNGVRFHNERRSDGVRVDNEKKSDGVASNRETRSDEVRVHHEKERWGESSL